MLAAGRRTRIKICGMTRRQDVEACVNLGVDALGIVFYPGSARYVAPERAAALLLDLPPFVSRVGLFVNASEDEVRAVLAVVPLDLLQFHGDETADQCTRYDMPYLAVARMHAGLDLLEFVAGHPDARAILLDAHVDAYGGGGKVFDWALIPEGLARPLVLSGGLNAQNVGDAVRRVNPFAVDVSSGVEFAKGVKDPVAIARFVDAVRLADDRRSLPSD